MKYRNPKTGEFKDLLVKVTDTLPVGSIVDYEGENIPEGWELVSENENIKTIKKIENNLAVPGMILNEESTSDKNAYSAIYINNILKNLNKDIASAQKSAEGRLVYMNYNNDQGMDPSDIELDIKLKDYARLDIGFYKATDFTNENGIWTTLDNITSFVVVSMYIFWNGSYSATYMDYHNNAPRVFERSVEVLSEYNKLRVGTGKINGQSNKYILVPYFIVAYKGDITRL